MATRAHTHSAASSVAHPKPSIQVQPTAALHIATGLAPAPLTDTATSTPSSCRTGQTVDQTTSPASSRTSLCTSSSTTSLQRTKSTMPPMKSPKKVAGPDSAQRIAADAILVESEGRPTRIPKPTTKAIELANNSSSKFYKSLKAAEDGGAQEAGEAKGGGYHSTSEDREGESHAVISTAKSSIYPAKQPTKQRSPTPALIGPRSTTGNCPDTIEARDSEFRVPEAGDGRGQSSLTSTAASNARSNPRRRKQAQKSDEVDEQPPQQAKTVFTSNTKSDKSKRKREDDAEADVVTPAKRTKKTAQGEAEASKAAGFDATAKATETQQSSKPASTRTRRQRVPKTSSVPGDIPVGGHEDDGALPEKQRITLKFPNPASLAGAEVPKGSDIEQTAAGQLRTKKGVRNTQAFAKRYKKPEAEQVPIPRRNMRKRKMRSPTGDTTETSGDELASEPTEPPRTKKAKHTPSKTAEGANNPNASPKVVEKSKQKSKTKMRAPRRQSPNFCNGLCLTMPEKIIAMYEIVMDTPNHEHTQEELDALMLAYCKCEERQDEEGEQPSVGKLTLKFRGVKKGEEEA